MLAIKVLLCMMTFIFLPIISMAKRLPNRSRRNNAYQQPVGKWFSRIMIIMLENTDYDVALEDPYFTQLAQDGMLLDNYFGVTHPSKGNYIAQIYGSYGDLRDDGPTTFQGESLVDLLENSHLTWKAYQEDYPGDCFLGNTDMYFEKHNPFISMRNIRTNLERCDQIVNGEELETDILLNTLPNVIYYTPNTLNDGHDTGIQYASKWLHDFLEEKLDDSNFMEDMLVVVTFDERGSFETLDDPDNRVLTILLGPPVEEEDLMQVTDSTEYDHYSLLRTIEENWSLGTLGRNDSTAIPFQNLIPLISG
ncbi:hypothetical protein K7432_015496 [Basidiobolus ranarum]|uniref:Acid phosphatase n=1 Tax=Basidiobolus ranarum TaxID=34480 RepID=A0ABR2WG27_9FUNG